LSLLHLKFLFPHNPVNTTHVSVSKTASTLTRTQPHTTTQHTQMPRIPTSKATHNNIESTIKTRANSPQSSLQKPEQSLSHKLKSRAFTAKNFFQTHTNPLPHGNHYITDSHSTLSSPKKTQPRTLRGATIKASPRE
jgi:hypothetical protein